MRAMKRTAAILCLLIFTVSCASATAAGGTEKFFSSLKPQLDWPRNSNREIDSYARWRTAKNGSMDFKFQVSNNYDQPTVAVEYHYYTTDVWGENRNPSNTNQIYAVTLTDKIASGKTAYTSYINIPDRQNVGRVYMRIYRVKFKDGSVYTARTPSSDKELADEYVCWDITW